MSRTARRDNLLALAITLLSLALYLPAVPQAVLEADAGEFQFVPYLAGIAHPTGYPLYNLIGWAWSHFFPLGAVAYRMNLVSAVFASLAVGLVWRMVLALCRLASAWSAWPAAAVAALAFAISPTFWSQAVQAEVYSLQAALLAALLLVTLSRSRHPERWWLVGLVAGLNLAHHRTSLLYLPAVVAALTLSLRQRVTRRQLLAVLVALGAPLLLYAYIPLRAPHTPYLLQRLGPGQTLTLYENTLSGFLAFLLGQPFGSALTLHGVGQRATAALARAAQELSPLLWLLALAGAVTLWRRQRAAAVLLLGGLITQIAFNLLYNIGDVYVLYIPGYLTAAVLAGVAIADAASLLRQPLLSPALASAVAVALLVRMPQARAQAVAAIPLPPPNRWEALLQVAPADAILVSNDRNEIMPMWYYQYVEGKRPDLTGLFPLIVADDSYADVGGILRQALASGRPVYLIKPMPGLEVGFRLAQEGPPVRVLGQWQERPQVPGDAILGGQLRLLGYDLSPQVAQPGQPVTVVLYWQPLSELAEPYSSYVHVVHEDGSVSWPGSDHRPGGDIYPATLWPPGQVIRDEHVLLIPADADPGQYRLIAGMYIYPSIEPLGEAISLGPLRIAGPAHSAIGGHYHALLYRFSLHLGQRLLSGYPSNHPPTGLGQVAGPR